MAVKSIEEHVEFEYKEQLKELSVKTYGKNEAPTPEIRKALDEANSKQGNGGRNYPDIQAMAGKTIPILMEVKGKKGKLEKLDQKTEKISEKPTAIRDFAVNGALHYGQAVLDGTEGVYDEVIIIGMNGSDRKEDGTVTDLECKGYYVARKNGSIPKHIKELDNDLTLLAPRNLAKLKGILNDLMLTEEEREEATQQVEQNLEKSIKHMHQSLYDDKALQTAMTTNEKLYLFCGLIMAGLNSEGIRSLESKDFHGDDDAQENDGEIIIRHIRTFLTHKKSTEGKRDMILNLISPVFKKRLLWHPDAGGISVLYRLYKQVREEIIPVLESPFHLDFTGRILNSLNDWVSIENDAQNDVVLTPRYVTKFMAKLCKTDRDSFVWDTAMGSGGFLVSAMDLMIRDAQDNIKDEDELKAKIQHIKEKQLMGIEILGNIFILSVLNMILMGDGSTNMVCGNSHEEITKPSSKEFSKRANVFLLNPPYSAEGKGLNFVEEALAQMNRGYGAVLIQENAGSGQGNPCAKRILKHNTLVASIHMPAGLFQGKASVQTSIFVFKINRPHEKDDLVKFVDMSNDGYARANRAKSTQEVNLRDTDHAKERYEEVVAKIVGKKATTDYYNKENGTWIEDTIDLSGSDWTFNQHQVIDITPTAEDFQKTVADYLSWRVSCLLQERGQ